MSDTVADVRPSRMTRWARSWLLAGPALAVMALIVLGPLVSAVYTSLYRSRATGSDSFVGIDNYTALATSSAWWLLIVTTVLIALAISLVQVAFGFTIALTLHFAPRIRRGLALAVLLPFAALPYAWTTSWFAAFDGGYLATWFGLGDLTTGTSLTAIVLAEVWRGTGLAAVICYLGLVKVSPALFESARADGARLWQRLTRVAFPAAAPAIALALALRVFDTVRLFDPVLVARDYPGATQPDIVAVAIFGAYAERGEFGIASAAAVFVVVLTVAVLLAAWLMRLVARRVVREVRRRADA